MKSLLYLSLFLFVVPSHAESLKELEKRLAERYEDFYTRLNDDTKKYYETKKAREEMRKLREQEAREREMARKTFRRKPAVEVSDEKFLKERAAQKAKIEAGRDDYIKQKKKLEAIYERYEIPEWVEYKLYEDTLVSDSPAKSSN